jgi:HAD superfamily hydrolase (TIGR01509 family)
MIEAVIFDMDGVLVDSEEFICQAAIALFAERGIEARPEDFLPFVGAGEDRYIGGVCEKYGVDFVPERDKARVYEIYLKLIEGKLQPLGGLKAFIDRCKTKGLKRAVASSADMVKVKANLREIGLPFEEFNAVINGQDVEHKKPAPDIFLLAAERIGVDIKNCLVVEDAVNGVEAAKTAGAYCLGLTTSFSAEELSQADWVATDLSCAPDEVFF